MALNTLKTYGSEFSFVDRSLILDIFKKRFTRDHIPDWTRSPAIGYKLWPVQFDSDREWLARCQFAMTTRGNFDKRYREVCEEAPTWPDNPELRDLPMVEQALYGKNLRGPRWGEEHNALMRWRETYREMLEPFPEAFRLGPEGIAARLQTDPESLLPAGYVDAHWQGIQPTRQAYVEHIADFFMLVL